MAKERLSKLQKWILSRCMEKVFLRRNEAREFYGKKFPYGKKAEAIHPDRMEQFIKTEKMEFYDLTTEEHLQWNHETNRCDIPVEYTVLTPKNEYVSTNAEEASISRSLRNLADKGFITRTREWGPWQLTEKGFFIAKSFPSVSTTINFKDYCSKIEESEAEHNKWLSAMEAVFQGVSRKDESPEKAEIRRQLRFKTSQFQSVFTSHAIFELCCEECKKKMCEFETQCGSEEIKKLQGELETS